MTQKTIYNFDLLKFIIDRDKSIINEEEYKNKKLNRDSRIIFNCNCGEEKCEKNFRLMFENGGAYCKNCTNKNANASGNGDGKLKKKLAYDDSKKEAGEEVTDIDDDDDDEKEWQNLKKSSLKQKSKENSGKLPFMSF